MYLEGVSVLGLGVIDMISPGDNGFALYKIICCLLGMVKGNGQQAIVKKIFHVNGEGVSGTAFSTARQMVLFSVTSILTTLGNQNSLKYLPSRLGSTQRHRLARTWQGELP